MAPATNVTIDRTASTGSHTVSWTAATTSNEDAANDITYTVQRKLSAGGPNSWVGAGDACAGELQHDELSCQDTVTTGGSYVYRVTAKLGGWSEVSQPSDPVQVTTDSTAPALTSLEMFDRNGNGKVDEVTATFNEAIESSTATTPPWTLANVPSGGSLSSVSTSGSVATLTVTEGAGAANTAVGSFTVALASHASGIKDAAGNQSSFAATAPADKAAPARVRTEMFDSSPATPNGKVDKVEIQFSETLASYTAGAAPWNLTGVPSGGTLGSVSVASPTATLNITEGGNAADTSVGSFLIDLGASAAGIRDAAGNQTSFDDATPADEAAPVRTALDMFDTTSPLDGKVDQVKATFSEALGPYTLTPSTTGWTLANMPGGSNNTLSSVGVTAGDNFATLTLNQGGTVAVNTSAGTWTGGGGTTFNAFTVALTANAGGVKDAAGNQASFTTPAAVTDKAAPIPTLLSFNRASTNDRPAANDRFSVTFSEPLAVASMCSTWSGNTTSQNLNVDTDLVTLRIENDTAPGTSNDRLLVQSTVATKCTAGRSFGTLDMGSPDYLTGVVPSVDSVGTGNNGRSELTWNFGSRLLTWELGTVAGTSTVPGSFTATWAPTSGMTDIAGNPLAVSISDTNSNHF